MLEEMKKQKNSILVNVIAWFLLLLGIYLLIIKVPIIWVNNSDFGLGYSFVLMNANNSLIGLVMVISAVGIIYNTKWKKWALYILAILIIWLLIMLMGLL